MINLNASTLNSNDLNFSMTTSSGDTIDLSMYDELKSELSYQENENSTTTMLSLSHSYGYEYKYEGNGLDEQDKLEIQQAMETIEPLIEDFMKKSQENSLSNPEVINKAFEINSYLPKSDDIDTNNYISDQTLSLIDKVLEKAENQSQLALVQAQKLFEALNAQRESFELYM